MFSVEGRILSEKLLPEHALKSNDIIIISFKFEKPLDVVAVGQFPFSFDISRIISKSLKISS